MTFSAYIERQKSLIRSRRGESRPRESVREEIIPVRDSEALLDELISFKGLNTEERLRYSRQPAYN